MKWLMAIFMFSILTDASPPYPESVYGHDSRLEVFEIQNPGVRELADSTMAMFGKSYLRRSGNFYRINANSLGRELNLCPQEKFRKQPAAVDCSAVLIGPSLVLTAGHCISSKTCPHTRLAFDFLYRKSSDDLSTLPSQEVYFCKRVRYKKDDGRVDFALIELDRKVHNRRPLRLASRNASTGENIFLMGYPSGIPLKYAGPGKIVDRNKEFFTAYIDTFMGNSGSPVFLEKTNEIVGVLVRGYEDYVYDSKRRCHRVHVCHTDECDGEEVTNIEPILKILYLKR
jgi:hypothetical protein